MTLGGDSMSPRALPEHRVRNIIRAAISVFNQKGFQHAKTAEIAKEANVAEGTIYNYFASKAHLFLYVLENGAPEDGEPLPSPDAFSARTERELLHILKKKLIKETKLRSIEKALKQKAKDIDVAAEIAEIFGEWWDILENNQVQIAILEESSHEFPEMGEIYDMYGRNRLLDQVEKYLSARKRMGLIRPLNSIPGMARAMMESISWFGWKQSSWNHTPYCPKEEILPDLIDTFARGLEKSDGRATSKRGARPKTRKR
jgi:AcrR family transcriptional regulator